ASSPRTGSSSIARRWRRRRGAPRRCGARPRPDMLPLRDANPRHGIPGVTWELVAINVAVFDYQLSLGDGLAGARFLLEYAFIPARFAAEPAAAAPTLVTSAFMHGSLLHLASNMVFLLVFGDNVEERMGKVGYLVFYLLGAAVATG